MSEHEKTSLEEAGGVAAGFTGTIDNWNADAEARMADTLMAVGRFVQGESGCLLGHIKAAVFVDDGKGLTLNLIDMDNGVEHHGTLSRQDSVKFNFMCAVLDVDENELTHTMIHAIDDSGLDYHIDKESLPHHHHHDHDHEEGEEHEHHHHHHEDGEECHCHEHHHHDDDDDDEEGECVCSCGHHHKDWSEILDDNGKLREDHHHHHEHDHDHDHEHEHGHCCHHHHD